MRVTTGLAVNTLVLRRVQEHRIWLEAVFHTIRYLIVNGLPFRGDKENSDFSSESFGG